MRPVITPLGKTVDSSSEEWRAWCEAKHVSKIIKLNERQTYIESVKKSRNEEAALDLMSKLATIWQLNKN